MFRVLQARGTVWNPICGSHQGQRPHVPREAGHIMTAADQIVKASNHLLPRGRRSTHEHLGYEFHRRGNFEVELAVEEPNFACLDLLREMP